MKRKMRINTVYTDSEILEHCQTEEKRVNIKKGLLLNDWMFGKNQNNLDTEKALNNLKSFRKGFEKTQLRMFGVEYVNYLEHEKFLEIYKGPKNPQKINSYALVDGNTLYIDLSCLVNVTKKEAYAMGLCIVANKIVSMIA